MNNKLIFCDRAGFIASAVSPIGMGLAYYQSKLENDSTPNNDLSTSSNAVKFIRALSIACTPLDYLIQVAITPLWIIFDDLRSNSTIEDWAFTLIRLPAKVIVGTLLATITQFNELIERVKDIYGCRSDELYYEYQGKWVWLTKNPEAWEKPFMDNAEAENSSETKMRGKAFNINYYTTIRISELSFLSKLKNSLLPLLERKNYTHCYINISRHLQPPIYFSPYEGVFADDPMPNEGKSTYLLTIIPDENFKGDEARKKMMSLSKSMMRAQPNTNLSVERHGHLYGMREFNNVARYGLLPLRITQQIWKLPIL